MDNLRHSVPLAPFTTFKIGGLADYFYEAHDSDQTSDILQWAQEQQLPFLILGGGSNVLLPDAGYRGLVIQPKFNRLEIDDNLVVAGSGLNLQELINKTLEAGLTGLEFVAGVPGTVGGAVVGNAGMYGVDMSSVVETVSYIDLTTFEEKKIAASDVGFAYRHSKLKDLPALVTEVSLKLKKDDLEVSQKIIAERLAMRRDSMPPEPSAGCFFKNVILANIDLDKLRAQDIDTDQFIKFGKIPTGFLIDHCNLKGFKLGGAQVSPRHANYIINTGSATAEDVIKLASLIKQKVRDTFGIQLQEEVRIIYN
ncbi:MAG: UDP-N-acetylmuramate dehydrogenase [Candidatus Komeilibacteria bacterium]